MSNLESNALIDQGPSATVVGRPVRATAEADSNHSDFQRITEFDNLFQCWIKAKRNKSRRSRIQAFSEDPLRYLTIIQSRLRSRQYEFGPYRYFVVREKKHRDVVDAPMKDRIVHWMLYDYLYPIWERRFIHHTYGNLKGRGTHAAIQDLAKMCRSPSAQWVLQIDISKYFYSIPHDLLKERVTRYVGDTDIRMLLEALIDSFCTDHRYDELFSPSSIYRRTHEKGMPIGNLTSQLFANIYLSPFDHWIKEVLQIRYYMRYVDDLLILGQSKEELHQYLGLIISRLEQEGLMIHPRKIRIAPVSQGIPYLGYRIWPHHISAGRRILSRYHRELRRSEMGQGSLDTLQAYQAMLSHTGISRCI